MKKKILDIIVPLLCAIGLFAPPIIMADKIDNMALAYLLSFIWIFVFLGIIKLFSIIFKPKKNELTPEEKWEIEKQDFLELEQRVNEHGDDEFFYVKGSHNYEVCLKKYCETYNKKKEDLTEENELIIFRTINALAICYLTYLVDKGYINYHNIGINKAAFASVKEKKKDIMDLIKNDLKFHFTPNFSTIPHKVVAFKEDDMDLSLQNVETIKFNFENPDIDYEDFLYFYGL